MFPAASKVQLSGRASKPLPNEAISKLPALSNFDMLLPLKLVT